MGLHLQDEGLSSKEVSQIMSVSQPVVYDWHHRWQADRLEGQANLSKSDRPPRADRSYVEHLDEINEQNPQESEYKFTLQYPASANKLFPNINTLIYSVERNLAQQNDFQSDSRFMFIKNFS